MDKNELLRNYANKSDDELLALYETDTLLDVAYEALEEELYNRGIHVPDRSTNRSDRPKTKSEPTGLSGWLVLVALGLLLQPIVLLWSVIPTYGPIFSDGTWAQISSSESEFYNPGLAILLAGEIGFNALLFPFTIYLAILFFRRDWRFPRWFIGLQLIYIFFLFLDGAALTVVLPGVPMFDEVAAADLFRQVIYSLIWIPYMLVSRRVKNTFVCGRKETVGTSKGAAAISVEQNR